MSVQILKLLLQQVTPVAPLCNQLPICWCVQILKPLLQGFQLLLSPVWLAELVSAALFINVFRIKQNAYIYNAHMQTYFLNSQFYLSDLQLHFTVLSCTAFQTKSKSAFSTGSE